MERSKENILWTELKTEEELAAFMRRVSWFHDSVLKELSYANYYILFHYIAECQGI